MAKKGQNEIAIIGMSGVFPEAKNISEFYQNLRNGRDSVRKLSDKKICDFNLEASTEYQVVGFIDDVDYFDHAFFGISKAEAESMDPTQRILLELTCQAIENAGYSLDDFRNSNTGVFIGGERSYYLLLTGIRDSTSYIGNLTGIAAGRISYLLNLRGPSMMIDTTCSSSMTAVYEAAEKILSDEVEYAIAGGVKIETFFNDKNVPALMSTLSPDGKCRPFDSEANGIGSGEGGGVVLLKRLDKAVRDSDNIIAVIKSVAINHDGALSNGLTAPSPTAQYEVVKKAWQKANILPQTLSYIETHGTGTKLGDPIEFQALTQGFKEFTTDKKICAIGSVKSNMGHLDNAAGITGLIKAVLTIKNQEILPSLNFETPNPFLDYENSGLFVNTELKKWDSSTNQPMRCGVSSFGLSGTNIHAVLEEYQLAKKAKKKFTVENFILKISAKSAQSFVDYCQNINENLQKTENTDDFENILYTLNTGRNDYAVRRCFVGSKQSIIQQLRENLVSSSKSNSTQNVLLFLSNCGLDSAQRNFFSKYPIFEATYSNIIKNDNNTDTYKTFASQFALLKTLEYLGISFEKIIGTGIGKITQKVFAGTLKIEDVASELINQQQTLNDTNQDLFIRVISERLANDSNVVFASISPECKLANIFRNNFAEIQSEKLLTITNSDNVLYGFWAKLYENGTDLNWKKLYSHTNYNKVEAPTYPFERIRCWFKPPNRKRVEDCFFRPVWQEESAVSNEKLIRNNGKYIVFSYDNSKNKDVQQFIKALSEECILVEMGNKYSFESDCAEIDSSNYDDFEKLRNQIIEKYKNITGFIYINDARVSDQKSNIYTPFFLCKAFRVELEKRAFEIGILSPNANRIEETDVVDAVSKAGIGFWKAILSDYPHLKIACVEYQSTEKLPNSVLWKEIHSDNLQRFVSYRNGKRFVECIKNNFLAKSDTQQTNLINPNSVYLITGGLGRIGVSLTKKILSVGEEVIVLGRSPIEHKTDIWNEILQLGNVNYLEVDFENTSQVDSLLEKLQTLTHKISGIYHLAGIADDWQGLETKTLADIQRTLAPKISGTLAVAKIAEQFHTPYVVLYSSLNSVVPKKHSWDYAAANSYLDGFVDEIAQASKTRFVSINWPGWDVSGNANDASVWKPISLEDGFRAAEYAIGLKESRYLVTDVDLKAFSSNPFFIIESQNKQIQKKNTENDSKSNIEWTLELIKQSITDIWHEVLKNDEIDANDDFFEIGGHSLNGMQVINRINKLFGLSLDMDDLFENGSITDLSILVDEKRASQVKSKPEDVIEVIAQQEYYDASRTQKNFWLLNRMDDGSTAHNMVQSAKLEGNFKFDAFQKVFQEIINRHDVLRTSFVLIDGELKQQIQDANKVDFKVEFEDLRGKSRSIKDLVATEATRLFDLEKSPLLRVKIYQTANDVHLMVMALHHIVGDGWSLKLLLKEVVGLYERFAKGLEPNLEPLRIQYKDYVSWFENKFRTEKEESLKYWGNKLSGDLPRGNMPIDFKRNKNENQWEGGLQKFVISDFSTKKLKEIASQNESTLFMLLMAILKTLLYKRSGREDIVVGTVISGRIHRDLENQIGNYLNTLALRDEINVNDTFREFLGKISQTIKDAYRFQNYPFAELIDELKIKDSNSRWLDVEINLHNYSEGEVISKVDELNIEVISRNEFDVDWNFIVDCSETKSELTIMLMYNKTLFREETIIDFANDFQSLVNLIVDNNILDETFINIINTLSPQEDGDSYYEELALQSIEEDF